MSQIHGTHRRGFTLIEILSVVAIITLMTALLVGASFRFVVGARETATATTIMKANGLLQDRVRAFQEFDFSSAAVAYSSMTGASRATGDVIARKVRFKRAFPQAFAELDATQVTVFFGPTVTLPPSGQSKYESGIVLYAFLMKGETFGAPTPGDDTFTGAEIKNDSETFNLPCLVDAWGEPLRFYRWPTRLIRCGESSSLLDYNVNSTVDLAGTVNIQTGAYQASPPIRPTTGLTSPTPASLLIKNLPPFDITSAYSLGPDGAKGVYGAGSSPENSLGWVDSDDPEPLNSDPDDPTILLYTWLLNPATSTSVWSPLTLASVFVTGSEPDQTNTYLVDAYHDPFTYSSPLIVSAGPDRKLGLYEPTDIPLVANPLNTSPNSGYSLNAGYLAAPISTIVGSSDFNTLLDNITNLNQQAGGR